MEKKIEDLTFIDDGMFQAVMHEPGTAERNTSRMTLKYYRERVKMDA